MHSFRPQTAGLFIFRHGPCESPVCRSTNHHFASRLPTCAEQVDCTAVCEDACPEKLFHITQVGPGLPAIVRTEDTRDRSIFLGSTLSKEIALRQIGSVRQNADARGAEIDFRRRREWATTTPGTFDRSSSPDWAKLAENGRPATMSKAERIQVRVIIKW